jgi:hypothetical protein
MNSKPAITQPNIGRPDESAHPSQSSSLPSFSQTDRTLETNPSYSASLYEPAPVLVNRRIVAGAQYQLMSRGYYRGRVDGKQGRETTLAVRAFQSSAGLAPTGRLDTKTLEALGSSDADLAYLAPASRGYETWMPVRKSKHGKWKMKWKRYYRSFDGEDSDEDRQANTEPGSNAYNEE